LFLSKKYDGRCRNAVTAPFSQNVTGPELPAQPKGRANTIGSA
jgi:hypothetical protein